MTVNAEDPRSKAQKTEADATTRRDVQAGNGMEKTRLKAEAQGMTDAKVAEKMAAKAKAKAVADQLKMDRAKLAAENVAKAGKKKKSKAKKQTATNYFTAQSSPAKTKAPTQ